MRLLIRAGLYYRIAIFLDFDIDAIRLAYVTHGNEQRLSDGSRRGVRLILSNYVAPAVTVLNSPPF